MFVWKKMIENNENEIKIYLISFLDVWKKKWIEWKLKIIIIVCLGVEWKRIKINPLWQHFYYVYMEVEK